MPSSYKKLILEGLLILHHEYDIIQVFEYANIKNINIFYF